MAWAHSGGCQLLSLLQKNIKKWNPEGCRWLTFHKESIWHDWQDTKNAHDSEFLILWCLAGVWGSHRNLTTLKIAQRLYGPSAFHRFPNWLFLMLYICYREGYLFTKVTKWLAPCPHRGVVHGLVQSQEELWAGVEESSLQPGICVTLHTALGVDPNSPLGATHLPSSSG